MIPNFRQQQARREAIAEQLAPEAATSAVGAYFYLEAAMLAGDTSAVKGRMSILLDAFPRDLALKYLFISYAPTFSEGMAASLLQEEPRFGEVHYQLGQRATNSAALVTGFRELSEANSALPDSLAVGLAFGRLELVFQRYADALVLFDRILDRISDESAALDRAIALGYLNRHDEAIRVLDDLLQHPESNPGDKYYWRAWNHLQNAQNQQAYDDANAALKSKVGADVYQLAGVASYSLGKISEAKSDFQEAVKLNREACDSFRYLATIEAAEKGWQPAYDHFTSASACYQQTIDRLTKDLVERQSNPSELYADQIAGLMADVAEATKSREMSDANAAIVGRNLGR